MLADLTRQAVIYFSVAGRCSFGSIGRIGEYRMARAFSLQAASMAPQVVK